MITANDLRKTIERMSASVEGQVPRACDGEVVYLGIGEFRSSVDAFRAIANKGLRESMAERNELLELGQKNGGYSR